MILLGFVNVLKPRLEKLAKEGWLLKDSYAIDYNRYDEIAAACRKLRENQYMPSEKLDSELESLSSEPLGNIREFESSPQSYCNESQRSLRSLMVLTDALCQYYRCDTMQSLLMKANEIPTFSDYTAQEIKDIGKATGELIECMGLQRNCLVSAGVFSDPSQVSRFIRGITSISAGTISKIPGALKKAWEEEHSGESLPEGADFFSAAGELDSLAHHLAYPLVNAMTEKGLRLANLDRKTLRYGVCARLQSTNFGIDALAKAIQVEKSLIKKWLQASERELCDRRQIPNTTYYLNKMAKALGVNDIFELEKIGKTALGNGASTSPNGGGFVERIRRPPSSPQKGRG